MESASPGEASTVPKTVDQGNSGEVCQILWPEGLNGVDLGSRGGYLVGWQATAWRFFTAAIITCDEHTGQPTLSHIESALEASARDRRCRALNAFCEGRGGPLSVIGEWIPRRGSKSHQQDDHGSVDGTAILGESAGCRGRKADPTEPPGSNMSLGSDASRTQATGMDAWLTVRQEAGRPVVYSVHSEGGVVLRPSCHVIYYQRCNTDGLEYIPTVRDRDLTWEDCDGHYAGRSAVAGESRRTTAVRAGDTLQAADGDDAETGKSSSLLRRARRGAAMDWRHTGLGTALVSPSARARNGTGCTELAGSEAIDEGPTDLELAMRQASCAGPLERGLLQVLEECVARGATERGYPAMRRTRSGATAKEAAEARRRSPCANGTSSRREESVLPAPQDRSSVDTGDERNKGSRSAAPLEGDHPGAERRAQALPSASDAATPASRADVGASAIAARPSSLTKEQVEMGDSGPYGRDRGGTTGPTVAVLLPLEAAIKAACFCLWVLEAKFVWTPMGTERWQACCDVSLVCAHFAARLRSTLAVPFRLRRVRNQRYAPAEKRAAGVIRLGAGPSALVVDAALGVAACVLLLRNTEGAVRAAHDALRLLHVDVLREELEWLNYFPAGFKLNVPLTLTLGSCTLVAMDVYASIVGGLVQWEEYAVVAAAAFAALGGATMGLAFVHDALRLLSIHASAAHAGFSALYAVHSRLLASLWRLFRGRKRNVLRHRVDTCAYDASRLLLGTFVFTVLFFLIPTVVVYYTFFCIVHAVAVAAQAVLLSVFVLVNDLPAYRLFLLAFGRGKVVTGFDIEVIGTSPNGPRRATPPPALGSGTSSPHDQKAATVVYFRLIRRHAPVTVLLHPYAQRAKSVVCQYSAEVLAKGVLGGKALPPLNLQNLVSAHGAGTELLDDQDFCRPCGGRAGSGSALADAGHVVREFQLLWLEYWRS